MHSFFFYDSAAHRDPHSFPTRRSSDLVRHAIHASRHVDAVPVNGGRLRQVVGEDDAYKVAFAHAQLWPRYLVVVSPGSRRLAFRSEEHTSELQSRENLVCRLLLEKKKI